jgi:DNA-binding MarR family transcriptional regulator
MSAKVATPPATDAIAAELLSSARLMNQMRVHDAWRKRAKVDLDRSGAAVLYKLYAEGENVRLTELAERLSIDQPAVTRKVQQLERAGLLRRSTDPDDARACRLRLTAAGRNSIERLLRARQSWFEELLAGWSDADRNEFARLLGLFVGTIAGRAEVDRGH